MGGVRRYQNKDGTLTEAGKKRIREKDNSYLNWRHEDKHAKNRRKVAAEYSEEHKRISAELKNQGVKLYSKEANQIFDRLSNSYVDKYAEAALKDLKIKATPEALKFVKDRYDDSLVYYYDVYDNNTAKKVGADQEYHPYTAEDLSKNHNWRVEKKGLVKFDDVGGKDSKEILRRAEIKNMSKKERQNAIDKVNTKYQKKLDELNKRYRESPSERTKLDLEFDAIDAAWEAELDDLNRQW